MICRFSVLANLGLLILFAIFSPYLTWALILLIISSTFSACAISSDVNTGCLDRVSNKLSALSNNANQRSMFIKLSPFPRFSRLSCHVLLQRLCHCNRHNPKTHASTGLKNFLTALEAHPGPTKPVRYPTPAKHRLKIFWRFSRRTLLGRTCPISDPSQPISDPRYKFLTYPPPLV